MFNIIRDQTNEKLPDDILEYISKNVDEYTK